MKLKMKKLAGLGLVAAMSLSTLAGCGNSGNAAGDTSARKVKAKRCQDRSTGSGCKWRGGSWLQSLL